MSFKRGNSRHLYRQKQTQLLQIFASLAVGLGFLSASIIHSQARSLNQAKSNVEVESQNKTAIASPQAIIAELSRLLENSTDYATLLETLHLHAARPIGSHARR